MVIHKQNYQQQSRVHEGGTGVTVECIVEVIFKNFFLSARLYCEDLTAGGIARSVVP